MEKLYDDTVDERMQGTALILQLARNPENLEAILFNGRREQLVSLPCVSLLPLARLLFRMSQRLYVCLFDVCGGGLHRFVDGCAYAISERRLQKEHGSRSHRHSDLSVVSAGGCGVIAHLSL